MINGVGNIAASCNPYGYDSDIDVNYSGYPMMNGGIFGGMVNPNMMGCGGYGMGDRGYGMDCGEGGSGNYIDRMRELQRQRSEMLIEQQQISRNQDLRINAPLEGVKETATVLKDKIMNNEQDQIMDAYESYVKAVSEAYGESSPKDIRVRANLLYEQMNGGKSLVQDLREYSHGSATQGFIQAATFGLYDRHSAEDNIAEITESPVGTTEKSKQNFGRLAGAATIGGIAAGIAKVCHSGKLAVVGLAAAGVAAFMSFITGKVTT